MNGKSNFASTKFRLVGVLVSVFLLTAFPLVAMVSPLLAIVNAPNPLNATYPVSKLSASGPAQSDKPHTMAATYYSFEGNLKASINLNNKGIVPLEVKPTLFNLAGERLEVPPVTIDATAFHVFDLAEWAGPGGPTFQQGSLQLLYRGNDMLLGAQVKIVDSASSVIFDEQLGEPATMFSSRLEGLWWLPTPDSQVSIAISNTTDSIQTASLDIDGIEPKQPVSKELILQPHQTVLIDPAQDVSDRPAVFRESGGISINHSGKPGSLIARAMVQNLFSGFSSAVQFADPEKAKSSKLHGAGLRLGEVRGEQLTTVVVARNISDRTAVLHGRIRYTKTNGGEGVTPLREVRLRAGEVKAWYINEVTRPQSAGVKSAGLEIEYSTQPGSVIVSALSVSRSGNHVFHVPMLDVSAQRSSTGAYPFYLYGTSSTLVYIKNTTAVEQQYVAQLNYEGGNYRKGLKTIGPGETVTIDIRALRDSQILDDEGQTIPLEVAHGQVRWTLIQSKGTDPLALIGRAEQVDEVKAISSTYACQNCCGDFFQESFISPSPDQLQVGQSATLRAFELRAECYGFEYPVEQTATWSSSNPSVATVTGGPASSAQVTSIGAGQTTITATWSSYSSVPTQCGSGGGFLPGPIGGCCGPGGSPFFRSASVTIAVTPKINSISPAFGAPATTIQVIINGAGFGADSFAVVDGSGISALIINRTATQLTASFDIALNATPGNHNVTVTSNNETSNSKTFTVRVPDHLVVLTDQQGFTTDLGGGGTCPTSYYIRQVQFRVVSSDSNGALPVGEVVVEERFDSVTTNTCGNGQPQAASCAPTVNNGTFIDSISTACGSASGPANCGYDINWKWYWCGNGAQGTQVLASLTAQVRKGSVVVNGRSANWPPGTAFRP